MLASHSQCDQTECDHIHSASESKELGHHSSDPASEHPASASCQARGMKSSQLTSM